MGQMPTVECGFQLPSQKLSGVLIQQCLKNVLAYCFAFRGQRQVVANILVGALREAPLRLKPPPEVFGELLPNPPFFVGVSGQVPAERLIEQMTIEIEGRFDEFCIHLSSI